MEMTRSPLTLAGLGLCFLVVLSTIWIGMPLALVSVIADTENPQVMDVIRKNLRPREGRKRLSMLGVITWRPSSSS